MSELFDYDIDKNWLNEFRTTSETLSFNASAFGGTLNDRFLRTLGVNVDDAIRKAIPETLYYWFDDISFESVMSIGTYQNFRLHFRKGDFHFACEENLHNIDETYLGIENWICYMAGHAKREIEYKIMAAGISNYGLSAIKEKEKIMPTNNSNEFTVTLTGGLYLKPLIPEIEKVIFNDPATIILWKDGTKTVVKVKPGEKFDKWTGFAMAYMKKLKGDNFHAFFRHWCEDKKDEK